MSDNVKVSRRSILCSAISAPMFSASGLAEDNMADASLVLLGSKCDTLAEKFDYSVEFGSDVDMDALEKLSQTTAEILTIQAKTIEGLSVKARAACWARLGDLDPVDDTSLDKSMALSIVRDLIRLHDPHLEHPGALKKLVEDATKCGTKVIAHQPEDII